MEFRILGSLEVVAGGRVLDLGGGVQRRILAALVLSPNRVVSVGRLTEVAWDGVPPATAERQVRNRVAALRSILTRHGGVIETVDSAYRIRIGPDALDASRFDALVAAKRPREALALWRGRPFVGLGDALARDAEAWQEKWLGVVEEHAELSVDDLAALVEEYPLRERLVGRLMSALDGAGRPDEAVAVYNGLARRLADRLGIDPSPALRAQHTRLCGAPAEPAGPTPRQLPPDVAGFTGRLSELSRLDRVLSDSQAASAVVISAIAGTAGVGKTALAVHWGHRMTDKFPDGQLYVNLRGFSHTAPVRPVDALGGFLRALGVPPEHVPVDLDAAAAVYHDLVAERQLLVILDNAVDTEQVVPLLPAKGSSLAVVTSRSVLVGLPAQRLTLEVLDPDEAVELLSRILGHERVASAPESVAELARLCAYLPLALRIAAANLLDQPDVAAYVAQLREGNRLAELAVEGDPAAAVRGAFGLSYARLDGAAQRMFRLLGLAAGDHLDVYAAASLAAVDVDTAGALLGQLASAHLIDEYVPGRFTFHDLLRLYARELAQRDPECGEATERLFDHYIHAAAAADEVLMPRVRMPIDPPAAGVVAVPVPDRDAVAAWVRAEHDAVVATVQRAHDVGADLRAQQLASMVTTEFDIFGYWSALGAVSRIALAAAECSGYELGLGFAHIAVGLVLDRTDDTDEDIRHFTLAMEAFDRVGDRACMMLATRNLAAATAYHRGARAGIPIIERAYDLAVEMGDLPQIVRVRGLMAQIRSAAGDDEQALVDSQATMDVLLDDPVSNEVALTSAWLVQGEILGNLDRHEEALVCIRRGLEAAESGGNPLQAARAHELLGDYLERTGQLEAARDAWRTALTICEDLGTADAASPRAKLLAS